MAKRFSKSTKQGMSFNYLQSYVKIPVSNNLDNYDKGKLMLHVRQVISLVTSHPYLPFCRHIIPIWNFISIENFLCVISFVNKVILVNQTKTRNIF